MAAQPSPLTRALLRRRTWSSRQNHRKRHRHRRLRDRIGRCVAFLAAASVAIVLLCATLPAPTEDFGTRSTRGGGGGTGRNSRKRASSRTSADGAPAGHESAGGNANFNSTSTAGGGVRDQKNYRGTSAEGGRRGRGRTRATAVFQLRFHTRLLDVLLVSGQQGGGSAAAVEAGGYYYLGGDADFPHYYGNPIHEPDPAADAYYYGYPRGGAYHPGHAASGSGSGADGLGSTSGVAHSRNEGCGGASRADSGCTRMVDMDRGFRHDMDRLADDRGWPRGDGKFEFAASRGSSRGSDDVTTSARPAAPRAGAVAAAVTAVLAEVYAQAGLWGAVVGGGGSTDVPPPEVRGNGTAADGDDGPVHHGEGEAVCSWWARLGEVARHWSLARGEAVSWALALWDRWMLGVAAVAAGADDARTRRIVAAWWAIDGAVLLLVVGSAARGVWDRTRRLWRSSRAGKRRQRRRPTKRKKPPRWRASLALGRLAVANLLRKISLVTGATVAKFAASRQPSTLSRSEDSRTDRQGPASSEESLEREPPHASSADGGGDHAREKAAPMRRLSSASVESDGSVSSFPSRSESGRGPSPQVVEEVGPGSSGLPHAPVVELESSSSFFLTVPGRGRPPLGRGPSRVDPEPERGMTRPPLVSPPKPVRQEWPPSPSRGGGPATAAPDAGSTAAAVGKKGKKKKKNRSASAATAGVDDDGHKDPASSPRPTRILQPLAASKSDQPRGKESVLKPHKCPVPTDAQREEALRQLRSFQLRQVERIMASRRAKGEGATTSAPGHFSDGAPRASPDAEGLHGRLPPYVGGGDDVGAPGAIGGEELLGCDLLLSSILNDIDDDDDDDGAGDFETKGARDAPRSAVQGRAPDGGARREEQNLPPPLPPPGFASALHLNAPVSAIGAKATSSCKLSYQRVVVASTSSVTSSWRLGQPSATTSAAARPDSPPEATNLSGMAEWVPQKTHTENASLHGLLNGGGVGGPAVAEEKPLAGEGVSAIGSGGAPCLTYAKLPFLGSAESFGNGNNVNGGDVACYSELSQGSTAATSSWGSSECSGGNVYDGNMW